MDVWYSVLKTGQVDKDKLNRSLDLFVDLGFDSVISAINLLEGTSKEIIDRGLKIVCFPTCISKVDEIADGSMKAVPWHDNHHLLAEEKLDLFVKRSREDMKYASNFDVDIYMIQMATHLESTFPIRTAQDVLEGRFLEYHDICMGFHNRLMDEALSFGFKRQMATSMTTGYGANDKDTHEIRNYDICKHAEKIGAELFHYCPTQGIHNGKYLPTMILEQNGLKKHFNCKIGCGAMGLKGFPTTASMAYLNGYDFMVMFMNEKTFEKMDRLTRIGYNDVRKERLDLIREIIQKIKDEDRDSIRQINRIYSKECYKNCLLSHPVADEHWSLDNLR